MELSLVPDTIPPRAQVQCPLEVVNLRASRDIAVLDFSYTFGTAAVNSKLRLPVVLNKFLQPISVSAEEFFSQWKSLSGPPLRLQEVVRGVKPMSLAEMANLFISLHLAVTPGFDTNPNNLVASTTFCSESTHAMLCLMANPSSTDLPAKSASNKDKGPTKKLKGPDGVSVSMDDENAEKKSGADAGSGYNSSEGSSDGSSESGGNGNGRKRCSDDRPTSDDCKVDKRANASKGRERSK